MVRPLRVGRRVAARRRGAGILVLMWGCCQAHLCVLAGRVGGGVWAKRWVGRLLEL